MRPSSISQLLGNPRWEKRLLKFLQRTKIGRIGPDLIDDEIRRVTPYEGWTDLVPDERSTDRGEQVADHILNTIVVRQTSVGHWAQCPNLSQQRSSYALGLLFVCLFVCFFMFFFLFVCSFVFLLLPLVSLSLFLVFSISM
jgi:hypothetical protein